jgi:hypothetical protein
MKSSGEVRASRSKGGEDIRVDAVAAVSLPIAGSAPSLIGLGSVGSLASQMNLVLSALTPTFFL